MGSRLTGRRRARRAVAEPTVGDSIKRTLAIYSRWQRGHLWLVYRGAPDVDDLAGGELLPGMSDSVAAVAEG